MFDIIKGLIGSFGWAFAFLYLSEYWTALREIYSDKLTSEGRQVFAELRAKHPDKTDEEVEEMVPWFCPSSAVGIHLTTPSILKIPKDKILYVAAIFIIGVSNPHLVPLALIFAVIAHYDFKHATAPWELTLMGIILGIAAFWQDYGIMFPNGVFNTHEFLYSLVFPVALWIFFMCTTLFFGSTLIGLLDLEVFIIFSLFLRIPIVGIYAFVIFTFLKIVLVRFLPKRLGQILSDYGLTGQLMTGNVSGITGWFGKSIYAMPALPWMFFSVTALLITIGHARLLQIDHQMLEIMLRMLHAIHL